MGIFQGLFSLIINLVATLIQIVLLPINAIINTALPDFSNQLLQIPTFFSYLGTSLLWISASIPSGLKTCFLFMIMVEIAKHTIFTSVNVVVQAWHIIQKIKFW